MKKVSKVFKIGISKDDGQKINEISEIEVLSGKGISGDRHFRDYNGYKGQITLIEKENIDYYNNKYKTKIPYIDFRRNIVTEGIELNSLIEKEIEFTAVIEDSFEENFTDKLLTSRIFFVWLSIY